MLMVTITLIWLIFKWVSNIQNREAINSNNTAITMNTLTIANQQATTQAAMAASEASLKQYVEQLVQAYMQQAQQ